MGHAEDVIRADAGVSGRTVIVRPTNNHPTSEHAAFSDAWRKQEDGLSASYLTKTASDSPPNMWISRTAIAAFMLDCVADTSFDGKAVSLFQGPSPKKASSSQSLRVKRSFVR